MEKDPLLAVLPLASGRRIPAALGQNSLLRWDTSMGKVGLSIFVYTGEGAASMACATLVLLLEPMCICKEVTSVMV